MLFRSAKRVSKIARGRKAKLLVFRGAHEKTVSGLRADGLMMNKRGKIVSKRKSAIVSRRFESTIKDWVDSIMLARQQLNLNGMVLVNGKSSQGKALYLKAKAAYEEKKKGKA